MPRDGGRLERGLVGWGLDRVLVERGVGTGIAVKGAEGLGGLMSSGSFASLRMTARAKAGGGVE
jgi:hypothetical protein